MGTRGGRGVGERRHLSREIENEFSEKKGYGTPKGTRVSLNESEVVRGETSHTAPYYGTRTGSWTGINRKERVKTKDPSGGSVLWRKVPEQNP